MSAIEKGGKMSPDWVPKIRQLLVDGSVLDLCCGSGRFYPVFNGRDYTGLDNDVNFAKTLSERHPEGKWIEHDLTTWKPKKKYDNIFTWVALQHIPPDKIEGVFEMMKETSNNIIMCERLEGPDPADSGYLWKHDYRKHFPGLEIVEEIVTNCYLMHWRKI